MPERRRAVKAVVALALIGQAILPQGDEHVSVYTEFQSSNNMAPATGAQIEQPNIKLNEGAETKERERKLDFSIQNLMDGLVESELDVSLEIRVPDEGGNVHLFKCRTDYNKCLWYPPEGNEYPGAGDIDIDRLVLPIPTGSQITIVPSGQIGENGGSMINSELLENALNSHDYGDVHLTLQNPDHLQNGYLKDGATFEVENNEHYPNYPESRA